MIDTRLFNYYEDIIVPQFKKRFNILNNLSIPRLTKICINIGTKNVLKDFKIINSIYRDLLFITGQKGFFTKSRKSISNFKLRNDLYIGCKITLRRALMYEFLDRLINIVLPRVKDFKGFSEKQFDKNSNFSFGIKECIVFPEIHYLQNNQVFGMNINIIISNNDIKNAKFLLRNFNFPFLY